MLQGAIDRGHQLEISYYVPSRDEESAASSSRGPITRVGDALYLDAWCHTANGDRAFRVDRIVAATELPDCGRRARRRARDLTGGWFAATARP